MNHVQRKASIFQIEYILILIAVLNFTLTEVLKKRTLQNIDSMALTLAKQRELLLGYDYLLYFSVILLAIAIAVIIYKILAQKNELELARAINEEQKRLSRNLHDTVAQDLAAVKAYLQKGDKEKSEFYADRALDEIRYVIDSLHINLEDSFENILGEMLQTFENNYEINTELLSASEIITKLPSEHKIQILHIIQEALSNIARHADAQNVTIKIADVATTLHLSISDDGKGFDIEEVLEKNDNKRKHWGLRNIQDRVSELGGSVDFIHNGGTTIAIQIKNPLS